MFGIFEATTVVLNGSGSVYDIKIMSHRGTNKFKLTDDNEFFKDSSFIEKVKEFGWEIVDTGNYGIMHRFSVKTRPYAAFEN
jgi:hypothetical protein